MITRFQKFLNYIKNFVTQPLCFKYFTRYVRAVSDLIPLKTDMGICIVVLRTQKNNEFEFYIYLTATTAECKEEKKKKIKLRVLIFVKFEIKYY